MQHRLGLLDVRQDVLELRRPGEGPRALVMVRDDGLDGRDHVSDTLEHAPVRIPAISATQSGRMTAF